MIYYHFASAKHFAGIQKSGIALGMIPWKLMPDGKIQVKRGFQWLTTDSEWDQGWDNQLTSGLPYRRTEYRITLEVPGFALKTLFRWSDFADKYKPQSAQFLNMLPGAKHWYVFRGPIPAAWFLAIDRNPTEINLPELHESN